MAVYDVSGRDLDATNPWRPPLTLPGGFAAAVTVGTRTFALVQDGDTLEVQELMAIE